MREVFCNRSAIYVSRKNNDLTMFVLPTLPMDE
jgi:hypothetical protein